MAHGPNAVRARSSAFIQRRKISEFIDEAAYGKTAFLDGLGRNVRLGV